jgi:hypothetical protein
MHKFNLTQQVLSVKIIKIKAKIAVNIPIKFDYQNIC